MPNGQPHVVGGERVGNVDYDFPAQIAQGSECRNRITIGRGDDDCIGACGGEFCRERNRVGIAGGKLLSFFPDCEQ